MPPNSSNIDQLQRIVIAPDGCETQVFLKPCKETRNLARLLRGLVAPKEGKPKTLNKIFGQFIIAPFTQLTIFNFDLQVFLFQVFHVSLITRLSHALFMPCVVFFMAALAAQLPLITLQVEPFSLALTGAHLYGILLCLWYLGLARRESFYRWWLLSAPLTLLITAGGDAYYHAFALPAAEATWYNSTLPAYNPLLWMTVSAFLIASGHAFDQQLPPRALDSFRWVTIKSAILDDNNRLKPLAECLKGLYVILFQFILGTINEWWASPRLMPYCWLMMMFGKGYKKERFAEIKGYAQKALESGNPALDYVGIGGGAYLSREFIHAK